MLCEGGRWATLFNVVHHVIGHASAYACVVIIISLVIKSHREFGQELIRLDSQSRLPLCV
jgi:hypothetical protein